MGVGEAPAAEVRHRVGFPPHHVVEDPIAEVLQHRADAEDVVIGADHPERAGGLQHALAGGQPGAGEIVVGGEARELVPVVIDRVDLGIVGTLEIALKLEVVGRVGENEIDAVGREFRHLGDAVANDDARRMRRRWRKLKMTAGRPEDAPRRDTTMTQNSDSGDAVGDAGPTNRQKGGCRLTVKIDLTDEGGLPLKSLRNHIDLDRIRS